jgi:hypothetical protein
VAPPPELNLALLCCRSTFADMDLALDRDCRTGVDWPTFVRLVRFHRVQGLVWRGLEPIADELPAQTADDLAQDAAFIAAANLCAAVESRDLLADFERAGVSLLFVKGVTLGALAYGDVAVKSGVDIDLLVSQDQLREAAGLLRNRSYRLVDPASVSSDDRLEAWHRPRKESVWASGDGRIQVDLHTRLADNPRLIPTIGNRSPKQFVEISDGIRLPTLAAEELFAYLTVHGASSAWFRLKWITDLAALLHRSQPNEIERLYRRSQKLGAGRAPAQALLLADTLYGTLRDLAPLREELKRESASRWLFRAALNQLCSNRDPIEPTSRPLGTVIIHLTQFALLPGPGFKLGELVRQARSALG